MTVGRMTVGSIVGEAVVEGEELMVESDDVLLEVEVSVVAVLSTIEVEGATEVEVAGVEVAVVEVDVIVHPHPPLLHVCWEPAGH